MSRYAAYKEWKVLEDGEGEYSMSFDESDTGTEDSLKVAQKRSSPRRSWNLFVFLACLALIIWFCQSYFLYETQHIPNQVHFVRLVDRLSDGSPLPLEFHLASFIAVYSAHLFLKPDRINIWTDESASSLDKLVYSSNPYTRAIASLPSVRLQHYNSIDHTSRGVPVVKYAHKSDFIRAEVMAKHGGVYFDDDAWVLRDLSDLRKTGYDNVFGRQSNGQLCQAMWMSKADNGFMRAWINLQDREFTGDWTKAGNDLITQLHLDFAQRESVTHALILEQDAFFPGDWLRSSLEMMYGLHDAPQGDALPQGTEWPRTKKLESTTIERITSDFTGVRPISWQRDWGSSYVIHGWSTGIKNTNSYDLFGEYKNFTVDYVLSRRSNIARALYPALSHAIAHRVLDVDLVNASKAV